MWPMQLQIKYQGEASQPTVGHQKANQIYESWQKEIHVLAAIPLLSVSLRQEGGYSDDIILEYFQVDEEYSITEQIQDLKDDVLDGL